MFLISPTKGPQELPLERRL